MTGVNEIIGKVISELSEAEKKKIIGIWLVINLKENGRIIDIEEENILMLLNRRVEKRNSKKYDKNVRIKRFENIEEFKKVRRSYGRIKTINRSEP